MLFSYTATNKQGRIESGTLEAGGALEARVWLTKAGLKRAQLKIITTQPNLKDRIAMNLLKKFLTTNSGWITRKLLEFVSIGLTALSSWAISHNVPDEVVNSSVTFLTALAGWLVSLGLSLVAEQANKELPPPKAKEVND